MEYPYLVVLLKFGNKEDIEKLLYKGQIKLRRVNYYRTIEDKSRQDGYENINSFVENSSFMKLIIDGKNVEFSNFRSTDNLNYNPFIYCMTYISSNDIGKFDTSPFEKFGDFCLIIRDSKAFFDRLDKKIREKDIESLMERSSVMYYEAKGALYDLNYFYKRECFKNEREYRIKIDMPNIEKEDLSVELGSIEDIAIIKDSKTLNIELKLKLKGDIKNV